MVNINSPLPARDFGGNGEFVYFLHANGYPPECYLPLVRGLASKYHVVCPLMRPLRENCPPESIKSWEPLSRDFLQYLNAQKAGKAIVIGHSLGSVVGLRSAIYSPESFRAIVLIDPVLFPPAVIHGWQLIKTMGLGEYIHPLIPTAKKRRRTFENLDVIYRAYRQKSIFRRIDDEKLKFMIKGMVKSVDGNSYELSYSPEWEVRIYYTGVSSDMDLWENIPKIEIPVLIIRGAGTNTFLPITARRVQRMNPRIRIESVERSTHLVPLERPEEVSQIILDYLETTQ